MDSADVAGDERFTASARRALALAKTAARVLNHDYIGPEHLLLGILAYGDSAAVSVLMSLGIDPDALGRVVEEIIGTGPEPPPLPLTPGAAQVAGLSLEEAGGRDAGPEHILLGLAVGGESVAAQLPARQGATLEKVRRALSSS